MNGDLEINVARNRTDYETTLRSCSASEISSGGARERSTVKRMLFTMKDSKQGLCQMAQPRNQ